MATRTNTRIAELSVDVFSSSAEPKGKIVFCHGAWVGGWVWETFAPHLADQGYECYVPTWRGRYDSKPVSDLGRVSVYDLIEDALAVVRKVQPNFVIGESAGGLIAQKVAEAVPDLKGVVLMNSAPPFMVPASPKVLRSQIKYLPDLIFSKPNMPSFEDYKDLILNNVPDDEAPDFYARICPESGRALREMSMGKIKVDASRVKAPVLVVVGHKDAIIPLKAHLRVAKMYNADLKEYPDMSHHTFSEDGWEKVAADVMAWLEARSAATVG